MTDDLDFDDLHSLFLCLSPEQQVYWDLVDPPLRDDVGPYARRRYPRPAFLLRQNDDHTVQVFYRGLLIAMWTHDRWFARVHPEDMDELIARARLHGCGTTGDLPA